MEREVKRKRARRAGVISGAVFVVLVAAATAMLLVANQSGGSSAVITAAPVSSFVTSSPPEPAAQPSPAPASAAAIAPAVTEPVEPYTEIVLGSSVQGRQITSVVFGEGAVRYLVIGGVHGDEWGAGAAEQFVERLKADPSLVPEGTQIHVITCLNPDGRAADTRGNANKVDINRNMPASSWSQELDPRDSSSTRNLTGGTAPGSEPESAIFIEYMGIGFSHVISLHSQGGIVDWDGEGGQAIAQVIAGEVGYPVQHLGYQAYIRGSMGAYVPEAWGIPIITVEMASSGLSDGLARGMLATMQ